MHANNLITKQNWKNGNRKRKRRNTGLKSIFSKVKPNEDKFCNINRATELTANTEVSKYVDLVE